MTPSSQAKHLYLPQSCNIIHGNAGFLHRLRVSVLAPCMEIICYYGNYAELFSPPQGKKCFILLRKTIIYLQYELLRQQLQSTKVNLKVKQVKQVKKERKVSFTN